MPSAKEISARVICISAPQCQGRLQVPKEAWVPGGLMLQKGTGREEAL